MKYALLFILSLLNGYEHTESATFDSLTECEASQKELVGKVVEYNASGEENKIIAYASVCGRLVAAPKELQL